MHTYFVSPVAAHTIRRSVRLRRPLEFISKSILSLVFYVFRHILYIDTSKSFCNLITGVNTNVLQVESGKFICPVLRNMNWPLTASDDLGGHGSGLSGHSYLSYILSGHISGQSND